jgi:hypothetical protein
MAIAKIGASNQRAWPTLLSIVSSFNLASDNERKRQLFRAAPLARPLRLAARLWSRTTPDRSPPWERLVLPQVRLIERKTPSCADLTEEEIMRMHLTGAVAAFLLLAGIGAAAADDIIWLR